MTLSFDNTCKIMNSVTYNQNKIRVIISSDLQINNLFMPTSKIVGVMLGVDSKKVDHKLQDVMKRFNIAIVWPHLEDAIQFWSPNHVKNRNPLKRVHRRASKQAGTVLQCVNYLRRKTVTA